MAQQINNSYSVINTTTDDLAFIYWMFEEAIAYQKRNNYSGWNSYDKAFLQNEIENKLQYKIVENDIILCVFSVCFSDPLIWRKKETGNSIYLHRITVNPKFKGQKQFAKVLKWAIEYANNNELETIRMDTWADNPTIIEFYKNYGFHFIENYTTSNSNKLPIQHRNLNVTLLEHNLDEISKLKFDNYTLRLLLLEDCMDFFNLIKNNTKRLEDFVAGIIAQTKTFSDTENFILGSTIKINEKTYFPYVIVDNETKKIIGFIDIKNIDWNIPKSELGFFITDNYSGKGITTKAIKHITDFYFDKLKYKKLLLRIHWSNKPSISVAEKCGFKFEGIIRNDYKTSKSEIVDFMYFGKVK